MHAAANDVGHWAIFMVHSPDSGTAKRVHSTYVISVHSGRSCLKQVNFETRLVPWNRCRGDETAERNLPHYALNASHMLNILPQGFFQASGCMDSNLAPLLRVVMP